MAECKIEPQRANGLGKLASLYRLTGRGAEARPLLEEALAINRRNGDRSREADVLNELGILLWQGSALAAAESNFKQAMEIREQLKEESGYCEAVGNLALVCIARDQLDEAMRLLSRKLAIAQRLNARALIANARYNIGALELKRAALDKALKSFDAAQRLYREMGRVNQAIDILTTMGEVCGRAGDIDASRKWFDQAIPLATDETKRTRISERLANILFLLLDKGHLDRGQQYVRRLELLGSQVKVEKK